jgi:hypothetical protein
MAALRKLVAWWELRVSHVRLPLKGEESCPNKEVGLSPPAPYRKGRRSARSTLEPVNAGKATADVASADKRRGSAHRAASGKGGGQ